MIIAFLTSRLGLYVIAMALALGVIAYGDHEWNLYKESLVEEGRQEIRDADREQLRMFNIAQDRRTKNATRITESLRTSARVALDGANAELTRLRDAATTADASICANPRNGAATATGAVLVQCAEAYRDLAATADVITRDKIKLLQLWPTSSTPVEASSLPLPPVQ